ncbi:hypothetical protein G6F57_007923 [Rhizopus arrhizus]|uniref:GST N-terminal domain-containing protein n=1 Tax=Rhizopus oryzae TaxID=64495 RepID=A0A9P6X9R3_RHIOR|nr:hypothetical protein G6F24_007717 [Rhizopus arrhizus]KAG1416653.1 hypothetical protein G6F58_005875 [Rhizopus delemar]KAG0938591.1 hypothetical protein G6F30_007680 [Rhizopus arrhizus]KAG0980174.1 hypothetical protein G6F29_008029 [Rhizopus arrhizus]KAG0992632.1 hypothetical protein G6F28_007455 [Rhizopus arrhizus]
MTLKLTLYTFKVSLWGAAPRLTINELNISNVKQIEIDISNARNFSPSYLHINPKHTVPALEIDEDGSKKYLNNTTSVIHYLNEIAEPPRYVDVYHKSIQESQSVLNVYQGISDTKTMFARNMQLWEVGKKILDKAESLLNSNGDYLFGRHSVADLHFVPYLFRPQA